MGGVPIHIISGCGGGIHGCLLHVAQKVGMVDMAVGVAFVMADAESPFMYQWHNGRKYTKKRGQVTVGSEQWVVGGGSKGSLKKSLDLGRMWVIGYE